MRGDDENLRLGRRIGGTQTHPLRFKRERRPLGRRRGNLVARCSGAYGRQFQGFRELRCSFAAPPPNSGSQTAWHRGVVSAYAVFAAKEGVASFDRTSKESHEAGSWTAHCRKIPRACGDLRRGAIPAARLTRDARRSNACRLSLSYNAINIIGGPLMI
jgi:hypothetical protein